MDILFENDYVRTPEVTREVYRNFFFKRPVHIVLYVILGVVVVWNVAAAIWFWEFVFAPISYVILLMLIQLIRYTRSVNIAINRDREQYGSGPLKVRMVVTEEGIQCIYDERTPNAIAVNNIKKVYKTKNLIVLLTKAQLMLIFDRKNFTVGDEEGFLNYLRSEGIKV